MKISRFNRQLRRSRRTRRTRRMRRTRRTRRMRRMCRTRISLKRFKSLKLVKQLKRLKGGRKTSRKSLKSLKRFKRFKRLKRFQSLKSLKQLNRLKGGQHLRKTIKHSLKRIKMNGGTEPDINNLPEIVSGYFFYTALTNDIRAAAEEYNKNLVESENSWITVKNDITKLFVDTHLRDNLLTHLGTQLSVMPNSDVSKLWKDIKHYEIKTIKINKELAIIYTLYIIAKSKKTKDDREGIYGLIKEIITVRKTYIKLPHFKDFNGEAFKKNRSENVAFLLNLQQKIKPGIFNRKNRKNRTEIYDSLEGIREILLNIVDELHPQYRLSNTFRTGIQKTCMKDFENCHTLINNVKYEYTDEEKTKIEILGKGSFGIVYAATLILPDPLHTKINVAVKKLQLPTKDNIINFKREALIMKFIGQHKNIVSCLGIIIDIIDGVKTRGIVLERVGGDLKTELNERFTYVLKDETLQLKNIQIALDIATGMKYLHSKEILHLDLAARNVLISGTGKDIVYKVGDYGKSLYVRTNYSSEEIFLTNTHIPTKWYPPEFFLDRESEPNKNIDYWSFGIIMYELITGGDNPYLNVCSKGDSEFTQNTIIDYSPKIIPKLHVCEYLFMLLMYPNITPYIIEAKNITDITDKLKNLNDTSINSLSYNRLIYNCLQPISERYDFNKIITALKELEYKETKKANSTIDITNMKLSSRCIEYNNRTKLFKLDVDTVEADFFNKDHYAHGSKTWIEPSLLEIFKDTKTKKEVIIGKGEFGEVKIFNMNIDEDVKKVVVKQSKVDGSTAMNLDDFKREAFILTLIGKHPNIVSCLGVSQIKPTNYPAIVFEYCPASDLKTYLETSKLDINKKFKFALDIATGMEYLHGIDIVHLDLAARNVLVCGTDEVCKITDFGLSELVSIINKYRLYTDKTGKTAPIIPMHSPPLSLIEHIYSKKSDVWSFGLTMYEILTNGSIPFQIKTDKLLNIYKKPDKLKILYIYLLKNLFEQSKKDEINIMIKSGKEPTIFSYMTSKVTLDKEPDDSHNLKLFDYYIYQCMKHETERPTFSDLVSKLKIIKDGAISDEIINKLTTKLTAEVGAAGEGGIGAGAGGAGTGGELRKCEQCGTMATEGYVDESVNQWFCSQCWKEFDGGAGAGAGASASAGAGAGAGASASAGAGGFNNPMYLYRMNSLDDEYIEVIGN